MWINEYICISIKNLLIHLTHDISSLIKLSFNTSKSTRGLDALSILHHRWTENRTNTQDDHNIVIINVGQKITIL
jgi:hypothetical protein